MHWVCFYCNYEVYTLIVCLLLTITGKIEAEKFTVYCNTELEAGATKRVAKALVDCKVRM